MDGMDYKIIAALREDAGAPLRKISKRVHMSESAVRKRVKQLERKGVIERYTVVVDPEKLGYNAMAVIDLDTAPEKRQEVIGKLTKIEEVRKLATSTGEHMITGEVWAHDNHELADIVIRKIGGIEGVKKVNREVTLEQVKDMC
ncbi:DNA-binding transcriptional activator DecR [subsurface metagenome]